MSNVYEKKIQAAVIEDIVKARDVADKKWKDSSGNLGPWITNPGLGLTILAEEVGEVARAILESDTQQIQAELEDVAQVAVAWLESFKSRDWESFT